MGKKNSSEKGEHGDVEKIKSLQEMIATAERTITSAKQMLAQLQSGSSKNNSVTSSTVDSADGKIVMGTFDGQIMIGEDGKQYPVPANYASKSKLIEGDMLKLTITRDGNFVYKQVGPIDRRFVIGIAQKDERDNFVINVGDDFYKILLAAATYFKIEPGDEVTIVVPKEKKSVWAAVENVVRKAAEVESDPALKDIETVEDHGEDVDSAQEEDSQRPSAIERLEKEIEEERKMSTKKDSVMDEWTPDIEQLKKEAGQVAKAEADEA